MMIKKEKSMLMVFCLVLVFFCTVMFANAQGLQGDVDENGTVDVTDSLLIARYYVEPTGVVINKVQADVNCDGTINILDALLIAQYYVGLINEFPCSSSLDYVPGEIIVSFNNEVSLEEADNLVNSFNLTWEDHFPTSLSVWMEVEEGEYEEYVTLLESYSIVRWAEMRGYSNGEPDKTYIIAHIDGTQKDADDLINSIDGITIVEYVIASNWGVVDVPVGEELLWINKFTEQSIVKYAELNHIMLIDI